METRKLNAGRVLRWAALLPLAGLLGGCWGNPVQRRLAGRWLGTAVENVDEQWLPAATGWAKGASLEFSGRDLTVAIPAEEPRSGRYQVVSAVDRRVELKVTGDNGRADRFTLELEAPDRARWAIGGGRFVILERER